MSDYPTMANDFVEHLALKYEPVGVNLYQQTHTLPPEAAYSQKNLKSYCHALVLAGEGQNLWLKKEQMGCKLGTSVLGFEKEMDAYLDDGVLEKYGVGLFATEDAASRTILDSTYLEKGSTETAHIAPLSRLTEKPQVVVFTANSQQVMWLLYADNYDKGGKMDLPQSGGALGGCADITALPLLTGQTDITFLGLGCRIKAAIDACHLMLGINAERLDTLHRHVLDMAKPIAMLNKALSASG